MPKALVVYATSEGQTRKIALHIAEVLRTEGLDVDVAEGPDPEVDPSPYDAVLLGASVHVGAFQKEATRWARTHHAQLGDKHDGFFGVCLSTAHDDPEHNKAVQDMLDHFLNDTHWKPDRAMMFAGALAFTQYGFIKRWIMTRIAKSEDADFDGTDHDYEYTNWDDVEAFARSFAREMTLKRPPTTIDGPPRG